MAKRKKPLDTMVATLGTEPQVVTLALEHLTKIKGYKIDKVKVVYTYSSQVLDAVKTLEELFSRHYAKIAFNPVPVYTNGTPLKDFYSQQDLNSLLRTLYREVRNVRREKCPLHLCISGGRKVMSIYAMLTAQLLFGPEDHLWYLFTEGWTPGTERKFHLKTSEDTIDLLEIPVLRWKEASTLVRTVAELNDVNEIVTWYQALCREERLRRQHHFISYVLNKTQKEIVRLLCRGFDTEAIADQLGKSKQTVSNQLSDVYEIFENWLDEDPSEHGYQLNLRSRLIAEFAQYFAERESY